jgi:CHAD domain-containing protein
MAFRLSIEEDPATEVRRCAVEELEEALEQLERGRAHDPVEAIHGARKNLKRTRSLLRLVRSDLGGRAYRARNRELRDIARGLSRTRDAQVMVLALQALTERYVGQVPATTFQQLQARLEEQAHDADDRLGDSIAEQIDALRIARDGVASWPLRSVRWRTLRRGLERSYSRGRSEMRRVGKRPTVGVLHEWRKRVKDLDYQQRLLREVWPPVVSAQAEEAHRLSDLLGDDHDLAVLHLVLHGEALERDVAADTDPVLELIEHRRGELQSDAQALGQRLYAERDKAFRRRLRRLVKAARADARAHDHPALVLPSPSDGRQREVHTL